MSDTLLSPRCASLSGANPTVRLVVLILVAWIGGGASASPEEVHDQPTTTAYRRIFVPADDMSNWPLDDEKYLPIEQSDFESWVATANRGATASSAATITEAVYSARLENDRLVDCRGAWRIALRGSKPEFLPLGSTSLVMRAAKWQEDAEQPVRLGAWGSGNSSDAWFGLEVVKAGQLEFEWQSSAQIAAENLIVAWKLPLATTSRLVLDLPLDRSPIWEGSAIVSSQYIGEGKKRRRRWELIASPGAKPILQIVGPREDQAATPSLTMHEELRYEIRERGLDIEARLRLEPVSVALHALTLVLPDGVQLVEATINDRNLTWRLTAQGRSTRALFDLPKLPSGEPSTLVLRGWQPLVTDRPWQLPKLRPEETFWTSGAIELDVAPGLELLSLQAVDCEQLAAQLADNVDGGPETASFRTMSPEGGMELGIGRRAAEATVSVATTLDVGNVELTARCSSLFEVTGGQLLTLSCNLQRGWTVDAVETVPASALREWYLESSEDGHALKVQLSDAVGPGEQLKVMVTGRQQRDLDQELPVDSLAMLTWQGARPVHQLLSAETVEPYVIETTSGLPRIVVSELPPDVQSLLGAEDASFVFDLASVSKGAALERKTKVGRFSAEIWLDATVSDSTIRHAYHLVCRPQAGRIEQLLVYASLPLEADVRWKVRDGAVIAERVPKQDSRWQNLPPSGELWQLRLARPQSRPVEIDATYAAHWPARLAVPLITLPEASDQRGRVLLRIDRPQYPAIEPSEMRSIALPTQFDEPSHDSDATRMFAAYRYSPATLASSTRQPHLALIPSEMSGELSPIIARKSELTTFVAAGGNAVHRASFELENQGASSVELRLPPGAQLTTVKVAGQVIEPVQSHTTESPILVPLPPAKRQVNLVVSFTMELGSLTPGSQIAAPMPTWNVPLLDGEWTVWLPTGYTVANAITTPNNDDGWRQRLFGPLGRPFHKLPFDPIGRDAWSSLVNRWMGEIPAENKPLDTAASQLERASEAMPATREDESTVPAGLDGWHAHREAFVAGPPAAVMIAQPPVTTTWSVAVFVLCLFGGAAMRGRRPDAFVGALGTAAGLCLLLPIVYAPMATGAFLGLLASLAITRPVPRDFSDAPTRTWTRAAAGTFSLLAAGWMANIAFGQSTETPVAPGLDSDLIHRVLVPADAERRPVGTRVYVGESLLKQLLSHGANRLPQAGHWLLKSAQIRGELEPSADGSQIVGGSWTITQNVEALVRDAKLVLPLLRHEARWSPTAYADGIPLPLEWSDDGEYCVIELAEPGLYEISIPFVPLTRQMEGGNVIAVRIPALPGMQFELRHPSEMTEISLSGALSPELAPGSAGRIQCELDGSGQFAVHWPLEGAKVEQQDAPLTELRWVRIASDGVTMDTRFVAPLDSQLPQVLVLNADRRWQLADDAGAASGIRTDPAAGTRHTIHVEFPPEVARRGAVTLRWRLMNWTPPGRLRLPSLELASSSGGINWLAVSSEPGLESEIVETGEQTAETAVEFAALWQDTTAGDVPQLVVANVAPDSNSRIDVRPRAADSVIDDVLHVAASADRLRVQYQADVAPSGKHRFQFPLVVPGHLWIEQITVVEAGKAIRLRWSRAAENRVNVFFDSPVDRPYRLTLIGKVALEAPGPHLLPRVAAATLSSRVERVRLYRDRSVLAELRGPAEADKPNEASTDLPPAVWDVVPVGAYRMDSEAAGGVRLAIRPNQVKTTGETLATISQDANTWWATYTYRLEIRSGELDTLQLRVPSTWTGPFQVRPDAVTALVPHRNEEGGIVSVRLPQMLTAGNTLSLELRGPLTATKDGEIVVPEILPETPSAWRHYISVPTRLQSQSLSWTQAGVEAAEVPTNLRSSQDRLSGELTLRVVGPTARVALSPPRAARPSPSIRLADTVVVRGAGSGQIVATRLVISPQGLTDGVLQLPAEQSLAYVKLDGHPARIQPLGGQRFRIELGSPELPQILEVVVRSRERTGVGDRWAELQRPVLFAGDEPIPVEMSLWTLGQPRVGSRPQVSGASLVSAVDQTALRLDRLVSIAEAATPSAVQLPLPDGYYWFRPWAETLMAAQDEARIVLAQSGGNGTAARVSRPADDQLTRAADRIGAWIERSYELLAWPEIGPAFEPSTTAGDGHAWPPEHAGVDDWIYCVADGGADRLMIQLHAAGEAPGERRLLGLLGVALVAAAAVWLVRQPAARDLAWRWPHAIGVLTGLFYWAWLWPSWLGLVIAVASVLMSFVSGWPGRTFRSDGSTVLHIGPPG